MSKHSVNVNQNFNNLYLIFSRIDLLSKVPKVSIRGAYYIDDLTVFKGFKNLLI